MFSVLARKILTSAHSYRALNKQSATSRKSNARSNYRAPRVTCRACDWCEVRAADGTAPVHECSHLQKKHGVIRELPTACAARCFGRIRAVQSARLSIDRSRQASLHRKETLVKLLRHRYGLERPSMVQARRNAYCIRLAIRNFRRKDRPHEIQTTDHDCSAVPRSAKRR